MYRKTCLDLSSFSHAQEDIINVRHKQVASGTPKKNKYNKIMIFSNQK